MQHEGMVHALSEIRRVLVNDGILIDLRPITEPYSVEVISARETRPIGNLLDLPTGIADDEAADRSIARAAENGWFIQEQAEFFPFYYSWDSPREMEEFIAEEWEDFIGLNEETKQAARSAWALADADARVRVKVKMLIAKWKVLKGYG
jgi:hypothetical protein